MYLKLTGNDAPEAVLSSISAITNHSKLSISNVQFYKSEGLVILPIIRHPLIKERKLLGDKYDYKRSISSTVTIHSVISCEINDLTHDDMDSVDLLFGITYKDDELFVTSVEEDKGNHLYTMSMKIKNIDIEIKDKENN
ncbi:MAG: hypothetical protein JSV21_04960 [Nitrospirota bacterium]|nr:MAG: hypothetical protein JSV21_04960 [Nitrospirota bacterium]